MKRTWLAASITVLAALLRPQSAAAQADHLEYLQAPQLVECDPSPYFRAIVNAVDTDRHPAGISIDARDSTKAFRVFEGSREHNVIYVSTSSSGGSAAQGSYIMLLFDTSGSMNQKLASGQSRFVAAKTAVKSSLAGFADGVDHIAVIPFDSHEVVGRINRAAFQGTRAGAEQQVDAMPLPTGRNNTAIYSSVKAALEQLKVRADAGHAVTLVVFSDGRNDVGRPGDDPGLLGDEGLAIVRDLAAQVKVPVITVGFGISDDARVVAAFRAMAWPTADNYYDAATNPAKLRDILEGTRKKLSDRIQILFGPVRESRSALTGQSITFRVQTTQNPIASRTEPLWNAPAVGVPLPDSKCTIDEARAITDFQTKVVPPRPTWPYYPLLIFIGFAALLAMLWFVAPRLMWPDSYIPKPVMPSMPEAPSMPKRPQSPAMRMDAPNAPQSQPRQQAPNAGGWARPPAPSNDQTVFISPPRQHTAPQPPQSSAPQRSPNRGQVPPGPRKSGDETVFIPPPKNPRRDE